MGMRAVDKIRARVNAGLGQIYHLLRGLIIKLLAPVEGHDDIFRAVRLHLTNRVQTFLGRRDKEPVGDIKAAVNADFNAVFGAYDLCLTDLAVGQTCVIKSCVCILRALVAEIIEVVVCGGDKINAALKQNIHICRRCAEIEGGVAYRGEISV